MDYFYNYEIIISKRKSIQKKKNSQYFYNIKKIKVHKISTINGSKSRVVTVGIRAVFLPPYLTLCHKVDYSNSSKFKDKV